MPDVFSFGLGGGSLVVDGPGGVKVGPTSVGYKLTTEALVFGGSTLTATDVIVAAGRAFLGDHKKVAHLDPGLIARTEARIADMLETAVERSRLSPEPLPVIVVGGGSILVNDKIGGLEVIKPHHFAVANAVGAAIAQVSGETDRVYSLATMSRADAIRDAEDKARTIAVASGARAELDRSRRCRGRPARLSARQRDARACQGGRRPACRVIGFVLAEEDLLPLSLGAAVLGTGGGGNPYVGMLRARELFRKGARVEVLPLEAIGDDDYIGSVGGIGAPVVSVEKIKQGQECLRALRAVEEAARVKVSALISAEIGGSNSIEPDSHRRLCGPAGR